MILKVERITQEENGDYKHVLTEGEHKYFITSPSKLIEGKSYEIDLNKCVELRANFYDSKDIRKIAKDTDDVTLEKLIREALEALGLEEILKLPFHQRPGKVDTIAKALHESLKIQKKNNIMLLYKEAYEILIKSQYYQMPMDDKLRMIQIEVELDKYWKEEEENKS